MIHLLLTQMAALAKNSNSSIQFLWSNTNEKSFSRPTTIWIHSLRLFKWVKEFERQEHALVMLEGMFFTVAKLKLYCQWVYNTLVPYQSMWSDSENQRPHRLPLNCLITGKMSSKLKIPTTIARDLSYSTG